MISWSSSIRVATESRIERVEEEVSCIRAPRVRSSAASGASSEGAGRSASPGCWRAKASIQLTEFISRTTCRKQDSTPRTKTTPMTVLR